MCVVMGVQNCAATLPADRKTESSEKKLEYYKKKKKQGSEDIIKGFHEACQLNL